MKKICGIGTSKGLAVGQVFIYEKITPDVSLKPIGHLEMELEHFDRALEMTIEQLKALIVRAKDRFGKKEAQIFEAHLLIMQDEEFYGPSRDMIIAKKVNAAYAVDQTNKDLQELFGAMDNAYMKERAADMNDLSQRLIRNLLGIDQTIELPDACILFCEDLEPSDTVMLDTQKIKGFVTEKGGKTSHTAIIARSIGLPALSGISAHAQGLKAGETCILDAMNETLILAPRQEDLAWATHEMNRIKEQEKTYALLKMKQITTQDGVHLEIAANIANAEQAVHAKTLGADGVGLFRTEFLYMNRPALPTVDEQFQAYKKALQAFGDRPMVIRTFDIGGDKQVPYLNLPHEMNPFLGYRAIRISLDRQAMFKDQLKALLMASPYGNLKVMFPMISTIDEIKAIKSLIEEVKTTLNQEGQAYGSFEFGIMVEIPVVAIEAEKFAKHVDFFSIGTNDLLQYTVAVDRMNENLAHLYDWYHPGLLRLIKHVADAAKNNPIWVGVCGETASDPLLLPFFVGLGIKELSMSAQAIAEIKWKAHLLNQKDCEAVANHLLTLETASEVKAYLQTL